VLLAAITRVVREVIAADPSGPQFRHGGTLGDEHKHWFRAKFLQQFRLFYRCSEQHKTVILGWVNDEHSLRAYNSKTDAYKIFAKMLAAGHPPDDWDALLQEARAHMPSLQIELLSGGSLILLRLLPRIALKNAHAINSMGLVVRGFS